MEFKEFLKSFTLLEVFMLAVLVGLMVLATHIF